MRNSETLQVVHFMRRSAPGAFSIENVFDSTPWEVLEDVDVRRSTCPCPSRGLLPRLKNMLAARRETADIFHITGDVHYLAILLPRSQTVLTIHDCGILRSKRGIRRFLIWLFWFRLPAARAGLVTTVSESSREELLGYFPQLADKVRVVHDPLPRAFYAGAGVADGGGQGKAAADDRVRVLQMGTKPNKNLLNHIEALQGMNVVLVIVGALQPAQRKLLQASGLELELHASVAPSALPALYQSCRLLLFASRSEGFGLPILEAQSVGLPVVTSAGGATEEVAGDGACLVDPREVESICEGIRRVLENDVYRKDLIARGYENLKRFDPAAIAQRYADVYKELRDSL